MQVKPGYLIDGSAVGFYGTRKNQRLSERSAGVDSFSHHLCAAWEAEANGFTQFGTKVCTLRLGVVLSADGGAFAQLNSRYSSRLPHRWGAGKHYFS